MEDLPVTLDDGELWIPSDIFRPEELHHHHHHHLHHNRSIPDAAASSEDLNLRFSRLSFDDEFIFSPNFSSLSQRLGGYIRAMTQYLVANPTPSPIPTSNRFSEVAVGPNEVDRGRFFNNDSGFVHRTPCPRAPPFLMHTPAAYIEEAEQLMNSSIGRSHGPAYERQRHNRIIQAQSRCRGCRYGVRFGFGLTRGCCSSNTSSGTGVFIPRTATNFGSFQSCNSNNTPGVKSKIPTRKMRTRKADDYHYHRSLPSDVVLPKEWTY